MYYNTENLSRISSAVCSLEEVAYYGHGTLIVYMKRNRSKRRWQSSLKWYQHLPWRGLLLPELAQSPPLDLFATRPQHVQHLVRFESHPHLAPGAPCLLIGLHASPGGELSGVEVELVFSPPLGYCTFLGVASTVPVFLASIEQ